MKRKLSLLLAMVLAMTMVMGISVTAFAASFPEHVQCGQEGHPIDSDDRHCYFVGTFENAEGSTCLIGAAYSNDGIEVTFLEGGQNEMLLDEVLGYNGPGWYSVDGAGNFTKCTSSGPTPTPTPTPTPKKESKKEKAEKKHSYIIPMISDVDSEKKGEPAIVDRDTFKSEAPSKTVIVADTIGAKSFFDMKVHAADEKTTTNQKFLASSLVRADANILLTQNIYPRRDLSTTENGALKVLIWNNLSKNQAGPVYAVVYNQIDGAYVINGILDANGTATFTGFKLRPASTITICK